MFNVLCVTVYIYIEDRGREKTEVDVKSNQLNLTKSDVRK